MVEHGTDLEVHQRPHTQVVLNNDQLRYIADTEFVPKGLRGNLPAILACVSAGRAIGIDDMSALREIHIINGTPGYSAELMNLLVRRAGHSITGSVGDGVATVKGKRADNGDEMEVVWTLAMAERAGLLGKDVWGKYPEAMLWARAVSQLCRMLFADCFIGSTYTDEELGGEVHEGEIVQEVHDFSLLWAVAKDKGVDRQWVYRIADEVAGVDSLKKLTSEEYAEVVRRIRDTDGIPFEPDETGTATLFNAPATKDE